MIGRAALGCLTLAFALAACGERTQTLTDQKKSDAAQAGQGERQRHASEDAAHAFAPLPHFVAGVA